MRRTLILTIFSVAGVALLATVSLNLLPTSTGARASHAGGADAFSIDMNPFGPTANTATTLASRQTCAGIISNGVQDADEDGVDRVIFDVTATQIPASTAMVAFHFAILHDEAKLTVVGRDEAFLLAAAPGSSVSDLSEPVPDNDNNGRWFGVAFDMGLGAYESGSGVLMRVTIAVDAGAGGLYDLALSGTGWDSFHSDSQNNGYHPDALSNAQLLIGGHCTDSDADGVFDVDEAACGGNANNAALRPERTDGAFATTDDDGDTLVNEPLPGGSETFDCDGDGWKGNQENLIFSTAPSTISDQDPCGNDGWPGDLTGDNQVSIADINSFIFPLRADGTYNKFGHRLDDGSPLGVIDPAMARWNLQLPPHTPSTVIDIGDYNSLSNGAVGSGAKPPMFGGQPAFGRTCPWPA